MQGDAANIPQPPKRLLLRHATLSRPSKLTPTSEMGTASHLPMLEAVSQSSGMPAGAPLAQPAATPLPTTEPAGRVSLCPGGPLPWPVTACAAREALPAHRRLGRPARVTGLPRGPRGRARRPWFAARARVPSPSPPHPPSSVFSPFFPPSFRSAFPCRGAAAAVSAAAAAALAPLSPRQPPPSPRLPPYGRQRRLHVGGPLPRGVSRRRGPEAGEGPARPDGEWAAVPGARGGECNSSGRRNACGPACVEALFL